MAFRPLSDIALHVAEKFRLAAALCLENASDLRFSETSGCVPTIRYTVVMDTPEAAAMLEIEFPFISSRRIFVTVFVGTGRPRDV